jgi:hypothetical protein
VSYALLSRARCVYAQASLQRSMGCRYCDAVFCLLLLVESFGPPALLLPNSRDPVDRIEACAWVCV